MKTKVMMSAVGLSLKVNEGKNGTFYQVSIDQDGEAGSLSMTEDAFVFIFSSLLSYNVDIYDNVVFRE